MKLQIALLLAIISLCKTHNYSEYGIYNETTNNNFCDTTHCILHSNGLMHNLQISDPSLISSSVIYGLLSIASDTQLSERCYKHMHEIYDAIHQKETWAMKGKKKGYDGGADHYTI